MNEELPIIKLYKGYSNTKIICIHGHILRSISPQRDKLTNNPFKNAVSMYRRYNVKPEKHQDVTVKMDNQEYRVKTDKKGYFRFIGQPKRGEREIIYQVSVNNQEGNNLVEDTIEVEEPDQIIVSDIDDTLLVSHSTHLFRKLYLLLTKNHETRKTFQGIRDFYAGLEKGHNTGYFYVSSSEWNLYDFLRSFISFNNLPKGVFFLQDLKSGIWDLFKSGGGNHKHKAERIEELIGSYPDAKFILVGDSGQKDPVLYREVALKYPDKITSIYIRDIKSSRHEKVKKMSELLAEKNIKMELFTDS